MLLFVQSYKVTHYVQMCRQVGTGVAAASLGAGLVSYKSLCISAKSLHSSIRSAVFKPHVQPQALDHIPPSAMNFLLLVAVASLASVNAAPATSTIHLRIHVVREAETPVPSRSYDPVALFGQCKFDGKPTMDCQPGLICQVRDQYYGQCFKERTVLWEQCGGKDWNGSCKDSSNCVRLNDYYSQCQPPPAAQ